MQNFGKIRDTFNNLLVEGIANKTDKNKKIFGKFVRAIKESNILKTQFNLYYDIEKKVESSEIKSAEFVRESISLMGQFSPEKIISENNKLLDILNKHGIPLIEGDYPNCELHENISKVIFTKKNSKTVNTIVESLGKIISYVTTNINEVNNNWKNDLMPNSFIGDMMVEKFNDRYSGITENEKNVIKRIVESNSSDRKKILHELGDECLQLINSRLSESSELSEKEALLNVKEALLTLEYTDETFIGDVGRIIELKKAFDV